MITGSPDTYSALVDKMGIKMANHNAHTSPVGAELHIALAADLLSNRETNVLRNLASSMRTGGYVLLEETGAVDLNSLKDTNLTYCSKQVIPNKSYVLLRRKDSHFEPLIIQITEKSFNWLEDVKSALRKSESDGQAVLLVNQGEECLGEMAIYFLNF